VDETAWFLPSGTLEQFRADLGLTYAEAGTVLALAAPGAIVGSVFSAAADHRSRRLIAAGGALGFGVALAAFAAGGSFAELAAFLRDKVLPFAGAVVTRAQAHPDLVQSQVFNP